MKPTMPDSAITRPSTPPAYCPYCHVYEKRWQCLVIKTRIRRGYIALEVIYRKSVQDNFQSNKDFNGRLARLCGGQPPNTATIAPAIQVLQISCFYVQEQYMQMPRMETIHSPALKFSSVLC
jgi:hypothetical protein